MSAEPGAAGRGPHSCPELRRGETMRRTLPAFLLGMACAATTFGQGGGARRPSGERSVLLRMEHEWNEALRAHDVAWFERNLADDVTDVSSGDGALHTKAEDIAALKADKTVYES